MATVSLNFIKKAVLIIKLRHEIKQRINPCDVQILKRRLPHIMARDKHARDDGCYTVKSLYFDNFSDSALREKTDGLNYREKFRIRLYNDDTSFIRLEKKSKINGLGSKQSAALSAEQVSKIIDGDIAFLKESDNPLLYELYVKMTVKLLRPKTIVVYERESFTYPAGNVRVTIDSNIRGSSDIRAFLDASASFTHLYHTTIFEVKWDEFLPDVIRCAVKLSSRKTTAFSKYAAVRF